MSFTRSSIVACLAAVLLVAPSLQPDASAQRAVRRAAPPRPGGVVIAAYYRPLFIAPFYDPFYDPFWFPYRAYSVYPGYPYGRVYDVSSSMRLQVTPREAEVYIDGYYAGLVDDFDGVFQRLHLEPGSHDVTIYLIGYRSITQQVYLQPGREFRIRDMMERLAPNEPQPPRPVGATRSGAAGTAGSRSGDPRAANPQEGDRDADSDPRAGDQVRGDARFGAIALRVQPADADVLIDGERWDGPANDEALVVQVAPGRHQLEVRKAGFRTYVSEVMVTAAETEPVNISLSRN